MPGNFHEVPESVVAGWPAPDYNTKDRRSWLPVLACTLLGVATVLVVARLYLRTRRQAGDFGLDDVFIFFGWLASVGLSVRMSTDLEGQDVRDVD